MIVGCEAVSGARRFVGGALASSGSVFARRVSLGKFQE